MNRRITRREWAVTLAGASAPLVAQQAPKPPKPAESGSASEQKAATPTRSERLRQFPLAASVEPAFTFRA